MQNRKLLLSGLLVVSIALGLVSALPAEPVQSGEVSWVIKDFSNATGYGEIIIQIKTTLGTDRKTIRVPQDMTATEKRLQVYGSIKYYSKYVTAEVEGNIVKVIPKGNVLITGIIISEIGGTGEDLTAVGGCFCDEIPNLTAFFALEGDCKGGVVNLEIGEEDRIVVNTKDGMNSCEVVKLLVKTFNIEYSDTIYRAKLIESMLYIDPVPCPGGGIVAGTTDTGLNFSFGMVSMEKLGWDIERLLLETELDIPMGYCGWEPPITGIPIIGGDPPVYKDVMAFPTPERFLGSDLNSDGDIHDTVLRYQNLKTGDVINTGLIVSRNHRGVDIYDNIIAFVGEDSKICYYDINTGKVREIEATGSCLSIHENIIAFASKDTVYYFDLSTQTLTDTGIKGSSPAVYQETIVMHTTSREPMIWLYDVRTGTAVDTGIIGKHAAIYGTVVAFETSETVSEDLNGDGDTTDWIIQYYNLKTRTVTNTGVVGKYPAIYKNRIAFMTPEEAVSQDLNGDSTIMESVIRVYDLKSGHVVNTRQLGTEPDIYGNTVTFYLMEQWTGRDLNFDGDLSDPIVETYQIAVTEVAAAGPEVVLVLVLLVISGITAYFKR